MALGWHNTATLAGLGWVCGYCGREVGGNVGYHRGDYPSVAWDKIVYVCPHCENPTAFVTDEFGSVEQVPGAPYGSDLDNLPADVGALYSEVRRCVQYTAYTAAVLAARKLLMHVAVEQGADVGVDSRSETRP